jgi:hypothetical protein
MMPVAYEGVDAALLVIPAAVLPTETPAAEIVVTLVVVTPAVVTLVVLAPAVVPVPPSVVVLLVAPGATTGATVMTVVVGVGVDTVTPPVVVEVMSLVVEVLGAVWAEAPGPASISASTPKTDLPRCRVFMLSSARGTTMHRGCRRAAPPDSP